MAENRYRPNSPPAGRRYADPRASTGMFISSSFDPARYSSSSQPRSAFDTFPVARPGSVYSTQGVAKRQVLDDTHPGGGSIVRTEYAVRPRNNSAIDTRRPVSTFTERRSSPPRIRPAIVSGSARDDPRSPVLAQPPRTSSVISSLPPLQPDTTIVIRVLPAPSKSACCPQESIGNLNTTIEAALTHIHLIHHPVAPCKMRASLTRRRKSNSFPKHHTRPATGQLQQARKTGKHDGPARVSGTC